MIKTSGNRVSPTEVEEAAIASGFVAEAVALGLSGRPARRGDRAGRSARTGAAQEDEFSAFLKQQFPNFMQPAPILWRDELPRSPNGKLDRDVLKNELIA